MNKKQFEIIKSEGFEKEEFICESGNSTFKKEITWGSKNNLSKCTITIIMRTAMDENVPFVFGTLNNVNLGFDNNLKTITEIDKYIHDLDTLLIDNE